MKNLIFAFFITLLVTACGNQKTQDGQVGGELIDEQAVAPENLLHIQFEVNGMTCVNCENSVIAGVKALPGIVSVSPSHIDSTTIVKFDRTQTGIDEITSAIENRGYNVISYHAVIE